jgi:hypothetical protein
MPVGRVRAVLSGFSGGPGVATFHFSPALVTWDGTLAQLAIDRVRDAYTAAAMLFTQDWRATIGPEVELINEASGQLEGVVAGTTRTVAGGNSNNQYAPRPVGLYTTYGTDGFVNGKRVRGRTFHVPVSYFAFETDGTPALASLLLARAFGTAMLDAGTTDLVFGIYSRPVDAEHATENSPVRSGSFHGAISSGSPDFAVVLRSRRD